MGVLYLCRWKRSAPQQYSPDWVTNPMKIYKDRFMPRIWLCLLIGLSALSLASASRAQYSGAVPAAVLRDPGYEALTSGNVYIDPRLTQIDQQTLQSAAM